MNKEDIGKRAVFEVRLEGIPHLDTYTFECFQSGAFKYGNGTCIGILQEVDGKFNNDFCWDTRYYGGSFEDAVAEWIEQGINPDATIVRVA